MVRKSKPRVADSSTTKKSSPKERTKHFVLITGLSGSGKGSVLKSFEDLGYHCVDNLPFDLILKFADMCQQPGSNIERAAAVVDIRGGEALSQLPIHFRELTRNKALHPTLVFMEASDKALIRRFEETRRPHPLGRDLPVREGIRLERVLLKPMRQLANVVAPAKIGDSSPGDRQVLVHAPFLTFGLRCPRPKAPGPRRPAPRR